MKSRAELPAQGGRSPGDLPPLPNSLLLQVLTAAKNIIYNICTISVTLQSKLFQLLSDRMANV